MGQDRFTASVPAPVASNGAGAAWLSSVQAPALLTVAHQGFDAGASFVATSGGRDEMPGIASATASAGGVVGITEVLSSGASQPEFVARDALGNLYFTDLNSHQIFLVCYSTAVSANSFIQTHYCHSATPGTTFSIAGEVLAGVGQAGYNGDGLQGSSTYLNKPSGIAVDQFSNVFFAEAGNHLVRVLCSDITSPGSYCAPAGHASGIL